MKVSELIAMLEGLKDTHGDIRVLVNDDHAPIAEHLEAIPEEGIAEYINIG